MTNEIKKKKQKSVLLKKKLTKKNGFKKSVNKSKFCDVFILTLTNNSFFFNLNSFIVGIIFYFNLFSL